MCLRVERADVGEGGGGGGGLEENRREKEKGLFHIRSI